MASSFWGGYEGFLNELEEDNDGNLENQEGWTSGRDSVIFLIDATRPMLERNSSDELPFEICLKCARNTLMGKIISSDKDLLAVVFFGTEKSKNSNDFKNIYVFQELDMPDAERIKGLEKQMQENELRNFENTYGHCDSFSMSDVLWSCSNIFSSCPYKLASKRVMLFTNTDDPHENNSELKRRALRKAKDLAGLGILIDLMHMQQPGKIFDMAKFYKDVVYGDDDENLDALVDPSEKFEEMLARVQCKDYKKRAVTRIPLRLSNGVQLGVSVFTVCRSATRNSYVKVDSRSNEEVKSITKMICDDTGQELLPTDIKYSQEFAGSKVVFEKNEVESIKSFGKTGLHLLGFKPTNLMKSYYFVKPGQFIYPDESTISGSKNLFSALLKRCLARNVVPICLYIPRVNAAPRLVALMAQKEELDKNGLQVRPSGFHLKFLPFSDDIRKLKFEETPKAANNQIDKAKEIVERLKFEFSSENFENPSLQLFYRILEALALDRDEPEPINDTTIPKTDIMEERAGKVMEEFKSLVFPPGYDATSGKRKKKEDNSATKKPKIEPSDVDMRTEAVNGRLTKLTVPVLKDFCKREKLNPESARKADLIKAINDHFQVL